MAVNTATIVYVAESDKPYNESVTLRKGQMLIGSDFGLELQFTNYRTF